MQTIDNFNFAGKKAFDCVHSTILQTTKNPFLYYTGFLKIRHCFMRKTDIFFC